MLRRSRLDAFRFFFKKRRRGCAARLFLSFFFPLFSRPSGIGDRVKLLFLTFSAMVANPKKLL